MEDYMEIDEKLEILSSSAKYDASCSSSGGTRKIYPVELVIVKFQEFVIVGALTEDVFLCLKF